MDPQAMVQLFVAISIAGMFAYYLYRDNKINKEFADKPTKNK